MTMSSARYNQAFQYEEVEIYVQCDNNLDYAGTDVKTSEGDQSKGNYKYANIGRQDACRSGAIHSTAKTTGHDSETVPILGDRQQRDVTHIRKMLVLLSCIVLQYTSIGLSFALGVIYVELIRDLGASHKEAALVQSLYMGMAACGIFFTTIFAKYSVGLCLAVGSAVSGTGLIISAFATNIYMVLVFTGLVGGLGMSICSLGSFVTVNNTFRTNRKIALGLLSTGVAVGQMTFPPLAQSLTQEYRWNGTLLILGGIIFNGVVSGLFIHSSRHYIASKDAATDRKTTGMLALLKDASFDMAILYHFIFLATGVVEALFVADIAVLRGYSLETGSLLLTVLGVTELVGRCLGSLVPRPFPQISLAIHCIYASLISGLSHFLVIYFQDITGMMFAITLRSVFIGMIFAILPGLLIEIRGPGDFPRAMAIGNIGCGAGQIIGGFLGGAIADATGNYDIVFYVATAGGGVLAALALSIFLRMKVKK